MMHVVERPVLVIIDVQNAIDDAMWGPRNNPGSEAVIAGLLAAWRQRRFEVVHVRHDSIDADSPYRPGQPGNDFKAEVQPHPGETIIAKQTNSAFIGTDLANHLTAGGGDAVFYCGVITNNSVEATVRMSGNLGFRSFVVADGCWTVDKTDLTGRRWDAHDVHALSLANLDGEYATVVNADEVYATLATIN